MSADKNDSFIHIQNFVLLKDVLNNKTITPLNLAEYPPTAANWVETSINDNDDEKENPTNLHIL